MGHKPTHKMSNLDRAKQFAPFSALKGLEKALSRKEAEAEGRNVPAEEAASDSSFPPDDAYFDTDSDFTEDI